MKRLSLAVSVCLSLLARAPAHAQAAPEALALATAAIEAQGGERSLRRIESVRVRAMVHEHALEQSVRPEGPYYENFSDLVELRRPEGSTLLAESRSRGYRSRWWREPVWTETATLVTGGAAFTTAGDELKPTSPALVPEAEESLALGPERALLTALAADDLRRGAATLHGAEHDTLHFTWSGHPVTIYLSKADHMPAAVELRRALPLDILVALGRRHLPNRVGRLDSGGRRSAISATLDDVQQWTGSAFADDRWIGDQSRGRGAAGAGSRPHRGGPRSVASDRHPSLLTARRRGRRARRHALRGSVECD